MANIEYEINIKFTILGKLILLLKFIPKILKDSFILGRMFDSQLKEIGKIIIKDFKNGSK